MNIRTVVEISLLSLFVDVAAKMRFALKLDAKKKEWKILESITLKNE